jgi:hypothetical protein
VVQACITRYALVACAQNVLCSGLLSSVCECAQAWVLASCFNQLAEPPGQASGARDGLVPTAEQLGLYGVQYCATS